MNYIVFDLEFNQDCNFIEENKTIIITKCPFEIIQIGALKLDKNLQTISSIDMLVKPELYTNLHPFIKEMTGITIEQLNTAKSFKEICKEFMEFITEDRSILCTWGMCDMKELFRNIEYHKLNISLTSVEYINLQNYASKYFDSPRGTNISLRNAVDLLDIPAKYQFHNALNDAYYTAEIFKKIYNEGIKPNIYNPYQPVRPKKPKQILDTNKLIEEIEKLFHREMTSEEKSIIKLSYMMGRTNQFQVEIPK